MLEEGYRGASGAAEELRVDGMPRHLAHKWAAMRDCVRRGREHRYGARGKADVWPR